VWSPAVNVFIAAVPDFWNLRAPAWAAVAVSDQLLSSRVAEPVTLLISNILPGVLLPIPTFPSFVILSLSVSPSTFPSLVANTRLVSWRSVAVLSDRPAIHAPIPLLILPLAGSNAIPEKASTSFVLFLRTISKSFGFTLVEKAVLSLSTIWTVESGFWIPIPTLLSWDIPSTLIFFLTLSFSLITGASTLCILFIHKVPFCFL